MSPMRNYIAISASYCVLTLCDGALRTIVLLHCAALGFLPLEIAGMFMLYEFMGVIVNLCGGHLATRTGLRFTGCLGLVLMSLSIILAAPVEALFVRSHAMVAAESPSSQTLVNGTAAANTTAAAAGTDDAAVLDASGNLVSGALASPEMAAIRLQFMVYIFAVQGLAGVGKDLMKISGKSVTKLVNKKGDNGALFKMVATVTGYKNAVKGLGYFLGGVILLLGYWQGVCVLACIALLPLPVMLCYVDGDLAVSKRPPPLRAIFSNIPYNIKVLSAARFWLFGSRDVWFEIAAPIFLKEIVNWPDSAVSATMGVYIVVYGQLQVLSRRACLAPCGCNPPKSRHVVPWTGALGVVCAVAGFAFWGIHGGGRGGDLDHNDPDLAARILADDGMYLSVSVLTPLVFFVFACIMAVLSAVHSYLVVLYAGRNKVAKDVGFYYMANAGGRLVGTLSSGLLYQFTGGEWGIVVCLWVAAGFLVAAAVQSLFLRPHEDGRSSKNHSRARVPGGTEGRTQEAGAEMKCVEVVAF